VQAGLDCDYPIYVLYVAGMTGTCHQAHIGRYGVVS
jgi:hypothetical protein